MQWLFIFFACGGLLAADRWLKTLALEGATRDFGFAQFTLYKNEALVFSWPAPNVVAIWLMGAAIIVVLYITRRMWRQGNTVGMFGCLLILTGAGSNLYDRIIHHFVIDWAFLGRWWPVFNLADVMIGVGLIMVIFLRPRLRTGDRVDKTLIRS